MAGLGALWVSRVRMLRPLAVPVVLMRSTSAAELTITPLNRTVPPSSLATVSLFNTRKLGVLLVMLIWASPGALSEPEPESTSPCTRMLPSLTVMSFTLTKSATGPLAGTLDKVGNWAVSDASCVLAPVLSDKAACKVVLLIAAEAT